MVENQGQNLQELKFHLEQCQDALGTDRQIIDVIKFQLENGTNIDLGFDGLDRLENHREPLFEIISLQPEFDVRKNRKFLKKEIAS